MAALRSVLERLDLLLSRLHRLPEYLRLRLSKLLVSKLDLAERDIDNFQAHCNDEAAVQSVCDAAVDAGCMLASATRDRELMDDLVGAAERTVQLLSALDTTTAAALVIDTELPR